jgi:hypothetical protein
VDVTGMREIEDPLGMYGSSRQVMIIKSMLIYHVNDPSAADERQLIQCYRSSVDVRVLIAKSAEWLAAPCHLVDRRRCNPPVRPPVNAARRKIFETLIDEFGARCGACRLNPARLIDHDHLSGIVRGLLCLECNPRIDGCLHAKSDDCHFARYLNAPPAIGLGLRYPARRQLRGYDRIRAQIVGFNLLDQRLWPSPNPTEWSWIAPPPNSLRGDAPCVRAMDVVPLSNALSTDL